MNSRRLANVSTDSSFGRRAAVYERPEGARDTQRLSDDLRLFALTFAGGFLFMTAYLA